MAREKVLTKEQIEWRQSILKGKSISKKVVKKEIIQRSDIYISPKQEESLLENRVRYMNNCMFWINQFWEGKTKVEKFNSCVLAMISHCNELLNQQNQK